MAAPRRLWVLLWQHCCFYRRHKAKLAATVLLPLASYGLVYMALYFYIEKSAGPVQSGNCSGFAPAPSAATDLLEAPLDVLATLPLLIDNPVAAMRCRLEKEATGYCVSSNGIPDQMRAWAENCMSSPRCRHERRVRPGDTLEDVMHRRHPFAGGTKCGLSLLADRRFLATGRKGDFFADLRHGRVQELTRLANQTCVSSQVLTRGPFVLSEVGESLYLIPAKAVFEVSLLRDAIKDPDFAAIPDRQIADGLRQLQRAKIPSIQKGQCACSLLSEGPCAYLRGKIFFWPRQNKGARSVLRALMERLDEWQRLYASAPDVSALPLDCPDAGEDEEGSSELRRTLASLAASAFLYANCALNSTQRFVGFDERQQALNAAKKLIETENAEFEERILEEKNRTRRPWDKRPPRISGRDRLMQTPSLWAMIDFTGTEDVESPDRVEYRLRVHRREVPRRGAPTPVSQRLDRGLQLLLDEAVVVVKTGRRSNVSVSIVRLPDACHTVHDDSVYGKILAPLLSFLTMLSFVLLPAQYLEQILLEKSLKMREYLYIMGVGKTELKVSWLLFYGLWLGPTAAGLAWLLVRGLPSDVLGRTEVGLLALLFLLFNAAQLAFATFLGAVMERPQRTAVLTSFVAVFFWVLSAYSYSLQRVPQQRLWLARLTSLHPVVPLTLAIIYIASWEQQWLGAGFDKLWRAPLRGDSFGGLGECLVWLVVDTALYFLAAWYWERIHPGEYGVPEKWWFPFDPHFWCRGSEEDEEPTMEELEAEFSAPSGAYSFGEDCVHLKGLTKIYARTKAGVQNLSVRFRHGDVTAFLGHNGAGKSTTLNMLVGLIPPTKGQCYIGGLSIRRNMAEIRKKLGYVPQYDILYPDMTVEEHLRFFGWLKGQSSDETRHRTKPMLKAMGLEYSTTTPCTALSGGQQRKLSIITAYLASPKVVILDEPTSGVDPYSRRQIWDWVLQRKAGATTILSTHFMDEADVLADRLAIISGGRLRTKGSPLALKAKFGQGFRLTVALAAGREAGPALGFVARQVPDSTAGLAAGGQELAFDLPMIFARSDDMIPFLRLLEAAQEELGIASFGVSEPTVEDVFFAVTEAKDAAEQRAAEFLAQASGKVIEPALTSDAPLPVKRDQPTQAQGKVFQQQVKGLKLYWNQARALAGKKLSALVFSPAALLMQLAVPLSFVVLFLLLGDPAEMEAGRPADLRTPFPPAVFVHGDQDSAWLVRAALRDGLGPWATGAPSEANPNLLSPTEVLNVSVPCRRCSTPPELTYGHCEQADALRAPKVALSSGELLYRVPLANEEVEQWILRANSSSNVIVGGFQLQDAAEEHRVVAAGLDAFMAAVGGDGGLDGYDDYGAAKPKTPTRPPTSEWHRLVLQSLHKERLNIYAKYGMEDGMVNAWGNLRLREAAKEAGLDTSKLGIVASFEEADFFEEVAVQGRIESRALGRLVPTTMGTVFVSLCFLFAIYAATVSVQTETISGMKRLEYLSGVRPWVYWSVNLAVDLGVYCSVAALAAVLLHAVPSALQHFALPLCLGCGAAGFMGIPFAYVLTLFRERPAGILTTLSLFNFVFYILGMIFLALRGTWASCHLVLEMDLRTVYSLKYHMDLTKHSTCDELFGWFPVISDLLRVFPPACMAEIVSLLVTDGAVEDLRKLIYENDPEPDAAFDNVRALFPISTENELWSWAQLASRLTACLLGGLFYLGVAIVLDTFDLRLSWASLCGRRGTQNAPSPFRVVDSDVNDERIRVQSGGAEGEPLILREVCKIYPGRANAAVAGVSFAVPPGQCFGLLGTNGAGKSSLFRLMNGFERATYGAAELLGRDVFAKRQGWQRFRGSAYCPQENTLFPTMTPRQHLRFFALVRGQPVTDAAIDSVLGELGLEAHAGKAARDLSGGNQRKVQLGIALLGRPSVVFLDEPTSGMDPGARRKAWEAIRRCGASVVLTSHSMDECEALCDRLAIMVAGNFQCLGSVQHLKAKFGARYAFKLKLRLIDPQGDILAPQETLTALVKERYPSARLVEAHATLLRFEVSSKGLPLSQLFATLAEARDAGQVEDFMVSQTSLEHVFVSMARLQQLAEQGFVFDMANQAQAHQTDQAETLGVSHTEASGIPPLDLPQTDEGLQERLLHSVSVESELLGLVVERGAGLESPVRGLLGLQRELVSRILHQHASSVAPARVEQLSLQPEWREGERKMERWDSAERAGGSEGRSGKGSSEGRRKKRRGHSVAAAEQRQGAAHVLTSA